VTPFVPETLNGTPLDAHAAQVRDVSVFTELIPNFFHTSQAVEKLTGQDLKDSRFAPHMPRAEGGR